MKDMKHNTLRRVLLLAAVSLWATSCIKDTGEEPYAALYNLDKMSTEEPFDENGTGKGWFAVSKTKKVRFSRGNLIYFSEDDRWAFSTVQYMGGGYFGYGTSGWDSGAEYYRPTDTANSLTGYLHQSLTGDYAQADWGVHNAIANGGNQPGMWRTLTANEWRYLLQNNLHQEVRYITNTANYFGALILFPEGYPNASNEVIAWYSENDAERWLNTIWPTMERMGAILLPNMGYFIGDSYHQENDDFRYWVSTVSIDQRNRIWPGYATRTGVSSVTGNDSPGLQVRLVRVE